MPPPKKVHRNLTPDPAFEPDFDAIRLIAPLPHDGDRYGKPLTVDDVVQFCSDTNRDKDKILKQLHKILVIRSNEITIQSMKEAYGGIQDGSI